MSELGAICQHCGHAPHKPGKCSAMVGKDSEPSWLHKRCKCAEGEKKLKGEKVAKRG